MRLLLPVALLLSACGTNPTPSRSGEELCGPGTRLADGVCAPTAGADAGGAGRGGADAVGESGTGAAELLPGA